MEGPQASPRAPLTCWPFPDALSHEAEAHDGTLPLASSADSAAPATPAAPVASATDQSPLSPSDLERITKFAHDPKNDVRLEALDTAEGIMSVARNVMFLALSVGTLLSVKYFAPSGYIKVAELEAKKDTMTRAMLECSCHGKPVAAGSSKAPHHLGTGCNFTLSIVGLSVAHGGSSARGKSPIMLKPKCHSAVEAHNHGPLQKDVVLAQWQSQESATGSTAAAALQLNMQRTIMAFLECSRLVSASITAAFIRQILSELVPFVPPAWADRIIADVERQYAEKHGLVTGAHGAMAALLEDMSKDYGNQHWLLQGVAGEVVALAWVPHTADHVRAAPLFCKGYAQVDTTFGLHDGYLMMAFVTTNANKSLEPLIYALISRQTADVLGFVMRCFKEHYLVGDAAVAIRLVTSDECPALALAFRTELAQKIAHHANCTLHKGWNMQMRNRAARSAPRAASVAIEDAAAEGAGAASGAAEPGGTPRLVANASAVPSPDTVPDSDDDDGDNDDAAAETVASTTSSGGAASSAAPAHRTARRNFSSAISTIFHQAATLEQARRGLAAACEEYPSQVDYIKRNLEPKLERFLIAARIFTGSEHRESTQLIESLWALAKVSIKPATSFQEIPRLLERAIKESQEAANHKHAKASQFRLQRYSVAAAQNQFGKELVDSLKYVESEPRRLIIDAMDDCIRFSQSVERLEVAEFVARCDSLPCDVDRLARVVHGEDSSSLLREYTPRDHALRTFVTMSNSCAGVLEVQLCNQRAHFVVADSFGALACSCGGIVDSLMFCPHMLLACYKGYVQLSVFAHCAPSTWSEAGRRSLSTERAAAMSRTPGHGRHPARCLVALKPDVAFDRISLTLDALAPTWRLDAVKREVVVQPARSDSSATPVLTMAPISAAEASAATARALQVENDARYELALRELIDVAHRGTKNDAAAAVLRNCRDELLRLEFERAHGDAPASTGARSAARSAGGGAKSNVKRRRKNNTGT